MKKPELSFITEDSNIVEFYEDSIDFTYDCGYCGDELDLLKLSDTEIDKIIELLQNVKKKRK